MRIAITAADLGAPAGDKPAVGALHLDSGALPAQLAAVDPPRNHAVVPAAAASTTKTTGQLLRMRPQ